VETIGLVAYRICVQSLRARVMRRLVRAGLAEEKEGQ
jgi:hypothetical protein